MLVFPRDPGIGPRGDGFVVGWKQDENMVLRPFDFTGTPSGPLLDDHTEEESLTAKTRIVGVPGGFPHGLGRRQGHRGAALRHDDAAADARASRSRRGFRVTGLAVNPARTLAAIVGVPGSAAIPCWTIRRLRFFHPRRLVRERRHRRRLRHRGQPAGRDRRQRKLPHRLGQPAPGARIRSRRDVARRRRQLTGHSVANRQLVGRRDAGFFLAWRDGIQLSVKLAVARVTLCTPARRRAATGRSSRPARSDGDGAANSDTTPDACRTTCQPRAAASGVTDSGEQCDDGNLELCDGCDDSVRSRSGDRLWRRRGGTAGAARKSATTRNMVLGDGCSTTCQVERIPGGVGTPRTDCLTAWRIEQARATPRATTRSAS